MSIEGFIKKKKIHNVAAPPLEEPSVKTMHTNGSKMEYPFVLVIETDKTAQGKTTPGEGWVTVLNSFFLRYVPIHQLGLNITGILYELLIDLSKMQS